SQRYLPMNGNLQVGQADSHMVEVVAGAGGHSLANATDTDVRNAWQAVKTPSVLYVTAVGGSGVRATALGLQFRTTAGAVLAGSATTVDCGAPPDTTPPDPPGTPTGSGTSPTSIDLSWTATSDPSMPITYRIYRDGDPTPIGQTTATQFQDTGLPPASSHTYTVDAVDAAGNPSAMSGTSDPVVTLPPAIFADDFST